MRLDQQLKREPRHRTTDPTTSLYSFQRLRRALYMLLGVNSQPLCDQFLNLFETLIIQVLEALRGSLYA